MKATIDFGEELNTVIAYHLDNGTSVSDYVRAAVSYFSLMLEKESKGSKCGYDTNDYFAKYNTCVSPKQYIGSVE